ncbi:MAG TPA: DoxX family protein [Thermoanaerobaculia bacterium]
MANTTPARTRKPIHYVLWTIQILLALLFLWAGGFKLVAPMEKMAGPVAFPELFLRFIGLAELLGGLGLILPSALRIRPGLTPLAAAGLVIIMIGATAITFPMGLGMAAVPLVTGILAAFVAYGRWRLAPIPSRSGSRDDGAGLRPVSA